MRERGGAGAGFVDRVNEERALGGFCLGAIDGELEERRGIGRRVQTAIEEGHIGFDGTPRLVVVGNLRLVGNHGFAGEDGASAGEFAFRCGETYEG